MRLRARETPNFRSEGTGRATERDKTARNGKIDRYGTNRFVNHSIKLRHRALRSGGCGASRPPPHTAALLRWNLMDFFVSPIPWQAWCFASERESTCYTTGRELRRNMETHPTLDKSIPKGPSAQEACGRLFCLCFFFACSSLSLSSLILSLSTFNSIQPIGRIGLLG